MVRQVCVIGAGMIGLSSAVRILESLKDVEVTVIADKFSPNTTSDVAAGFLMPYKMGNTPPELIRRWSIATFDYLFDLHNSPLAIECGINTLSGYLLFTGKKWDMTWKDVVLHVRDLTPRELEVFPEASDGVFLTSIVVTGSIYLPWIMSKFVALGGKVKTGKVKSLSELTPKYDAIINCCGLGNYELLNDQTMNSIRGQVMRVNAPWLKHFVVLDRHAMPGAPVYIFPTFHDVVLGGTAQVGNWNLEKSEQDKKRILDDCARLVPSLKDPAIVHELVGLRPFRDTARLDKEIHLENDRRVVVINNYGHGGSGLTTFWGCAADVVQHLADEFSQSLIQSKL